MHRPASRLAAVTLLVLSAVAGPAAGQAESEGDLRRENQRLKAQVTDLQQELDAARVRIADLEKQIKQLASRSPAPPAAAPAPAAPEQVSIDESAPRASPRALFKAMQQSYQEAVGDLELGDPATAPGERQRITYQRAVRSWTARVHRELKGPVEWHVRIVRVIETEGDVVVRAQAVDPATHAVLGDPFAMVIDKAIRHRLEQLLEPGAPEVLVVKGVLLPQPTMNPQRLEPGTFDKPPFLGPMAEFGFLVDAASLNPAPPPPPEQQPGGN